MSTRERIEAKLATMDESQLVALYPIVEQIAETKPPEANLSLMAKLRRIKIDAPEDFAASQFSLEDGTSRL